MAVDGKALGTSLGINGGLCVLFLLIFSVLRTGAVTRRFYAPKRYDPEVKVKPRKLRMGLLSWISPVLFYPEDEIMAVSGLDVVVFLRLLKYGLVLFGFCTIWCIGVILPVNYTAHGLQRQGNTTATEIDWLSMSNIPPTQQDRHRLWAHLISAYVITAVALTLLVRFSKDISLLRARFISSRQRTATSLTVLVTDVPGVERNTMEGMVPDPVKKGAAEAAEAVTDKTSAALETARGAALQETMPAAPAGTGADASPEAEALPESISDPWRAARGVIKGGGDVQSLIDHEMRGTYGAHVAAVTPVYDTAQVAPVVAKYSATKGALDDIVDDYIGKLRRKIDIDPKKRKMVTLLPALAPAWAREKYSVGAKPVKVDALEYMPLELERLRDEVKDKAAHASESYLPAAFVTFNDRYTQTLASTGLHSHDELCWRVQAAPSADEIIWSNLGIRHWQRIVRNLAMWSAFIGILLLYLPVVGAIQALVNIENARRIQGINKIVELPFVAQILQGILPSLVLKIFLAILPMILNMMNRFTGMPSISQVDFATVSKFFIFQVFAVFIYSFVLGSALSQIDAIVKDPSTIVRLLGVAAPQQATFFMTFIMISALANGFRLLRIVGLVIYFIKDMLAGTEKAKYRLWANQQFMFGTFVANHTMVALLGLSYCCISPLIAPFCLLYFFLATLSQKYQLIYVLKHPYEAAGKMWGAVFNQLMVGIYFLQAIVATVLGVKKFAFAVIILPLLFFTAIFHVVVYNLFHRPWNITSLQVAALLDKREGGKALSPEEESSLHQIYLNPAFKIDDREHDELVSNAKLVDQQLRGGGTGELKIDDIEISKEESVTQDSKA